MALSSLLAVFLHSFSKYLTSLLQGDKWLYYKALPDVNHLLPWTGIALKLWKLDQLSAGHNTGSETCLGADIVLSPWLALLITCLTLSISCTVSQRDSYIVCNNKLQMQQTLFCGGEWAVRS